MDLNDYDIESLLNKYELKFKKSDELISLFNRIYKNDIKYFKNYLEIN